MLKVFTFIDSQNLNLGVKSQNWELDWKKFRQYLRDKYRVTQAYLFIGYKPGNENLYTSLQKLGYIVVLKPTMELPGGVVKGNVDAELVLHSMIHWDEYDKAILVSGDGDFFCLAEYFEKNSKLLHIITPNQKYSKLYKPLAKYIVRMDQLKITLEKRVKTKQKKTGISGRSKP